MKCQRCGQSELFFLFYTDDNSMNEEENTSDDEMMLRRELNKELRTAIVNEDYEKAAELRDKIRAIDVQI